MQADMLPPRLVIFDCDGVLVDTEGPVNEVLAENLAQYGPRLTAQECIDRFVGGTMTDVGRRAASHGYALPKNWTDEIYAAMFARLKEGVDVIPGVFELLDLLDALQISYCVGSNGPMEKMEITLTPSGLMERLAGRIYSPHVIGLEHAKPSGGLYAHALREMGVPAHEAVVIEDSASGARGAKNAGIRCFGLTRETPRARLEAEDAVPFGHMNDLVGLLKLK